MTGRGEASIGLGEWGKRHERCCFTTLVDENEIESGLHFLRAEFGVGIALSGVLIRCCVGDSGHEVLDTRRVEKAEYMTGVYIRSN